MNQSFNYSAALIIAALTATSAKSATILGIDVSSVQGNINWSSVASDGVEFAFARATVGVGFQDSDFVANMTHGKAAGLHMGAYEFSELDVNTPSQEANYFWSFAGAYIKADGKSLMPAIDFEVFNGHVGASSYTAWFNTWATDIKAKTTVFLHPVIYVDACSGACDLSTNIGLYGWIANYNSGLANSPWGTCASCNAWDPNGTGGWTYWQFTNSGAITGISGDVDLDRFNGTLATLKSTQGVGGN